MMKGYISYSRSYLLFITITVISGSALIGQNKNIEKLKGDWILSGIKTVPYITSKEIPILNTLHDSILFLHIDEVFTIQEIEKYYTNDKSTSYSFEIIEESPKKKSLYLTPIGQTGKRKKRRSETHEIEMQILKCNNSKLTLKLWSYNPSNPIKDFGYSVYYFDKQSSTNELDESQFYGVWNMLHDYNELSELDTILLSGDRHLIVGGINTTEVQFQFKLKMEDQDAFSVCRTSGNTILQGMSSQEGLWTLDPKNQIVILTFSNEEPLFFYFSFSKNELHLVRKFRTKP